MLQFPENLVMRQMQSGLRFHADVLPGTHQSGSNKTARLWLLRCMEQGVAHGEQDINCFGPLTLATLGHMLIMRVACTNHQVGYKPAHSPGPQAAASRTMIMACAHHNAGCIGNAILHVTTCRKTLAVVSECSTSYR